MSPAASWLLVITAGALTLWIVFRIDAYLWRRRHEHADREHARYQRAMRSVAAAQRHPSNRTRIGHADHDRRNDTND
jgi:hypothetical protein